MKKWELKWNVCVGRWFGAGKGYYHIHGTHGVDNRAVLSLITGKYKYAEDGEVHV